MGMDGNEQFCYVKEYRYTRMGGRTHPIAVCQTCRQIIEPVYVRLTKMETHGEVFYAHQHKLAFLTLVSSHSGRRWYYISSDTPEDLKAILKDAGELWAFYHYNDYDDIVDFISKKLGAQESGSSAGSRPATETKAEATQTTKVVRPEFDPAGEAEMLEDFAVECLFENFAAELEFVARKYAPKVRQLYRAVNDLQGLDELIDFVIARLIKVLEQDAKYAFDLGSVYNIKEWLDKLPEVEEW